jgi:hypothetical protein
MNQHVTEWITTWVNGAFYDQANNQPGACGPSILIGISYVSVQILALAPYRPSVQHRIWFV